MSFFVQEKALLCLTLNKSSSSFGSSPSGISALERSRTNGLSKPAVGDGMEGVGEEGVGELGVGGVVGIGECLSLDGEEFCGSFTLGVVWGLHSGDEVVICSVNSSTFA